MKKATSISSLPTGVFTFKNVLLTCGIMASILYVAMNIFIAMRYPGYNSANYTVSELPAIEAPTRYFRGFCLYFLMMAFWVGSYKSGL